MVRLIVGSTHPVTPFEEIGCMVVQRDHVVDPPESLFQHPASGFLENGFVVVRGALEKAVLLECVDAIDHELHKHALDPKDPNTWNKPVIRFYCPEGPAFARAGTSTALRTPWYKSPALTS